MATMNEDEIEGSFDRWEDSGQTASSSQQDALAYRPTKRPPMAVLVAFDDGSHTGEAVRLRRDRFTIGRENADLTIAHDRGISPFHVVITRVERDRGFTWRIEDQNSKTGLLVRVRKSRLRENSEFLAGNHRYRYTSAFAGSQSGNSELGHRLAGGSIPGSSVLDQQIRYPSIRCIDLKGDEQILWLIAGEYWIGRDASCGLCIPSDPFLASKHVQLVQDAGSWQVCTHHVRNGMWIRVSHIDVTTTCTFQLGEQRFRLYTDFSRRKVKEHQV